MDYIDILYKTYELKINARNSHHDNFHKWMTFYSVAIGSIIVAFYEFNKTGFLSVFFIFFGMIISFLWHMSCKGYKHWTDHWIKEIWKFEELIEKEISKNPDITFPVYCKVYYNQPLTQRFKFNPFQSAMISTPKVILGLSYISFLAWILLFLWKLLKLSNWESASFFNQILMILLILCIGMLIHFLFFRFTELLYSDSQEKILK